MLLYFLTGMRDYKFFEKNVEMIIRRNGDGDDRTIIRWNCVVVFFNRNERL